MSIPSSLTPLFSTGSSAAAAYQIERSLRFNSSDSGFCSRTFGANPVTRTKLHLHWCVKRGVLGVDQRMISGYDGSSPDSFVLAFTSSDTLRLLVGGGGDLYTTAVFRDPSAWYIIDLAFDSTISSPSADRAKLWVNGTLQTWASGTVTLNALHHFAYGNSNNRIGCGWDNTSFCSLYLAEVFFIDGQALTPSSFTEVSATTGQLIPLAYTGTFGTNGFWLKFSDNSAATAATLGKDYSGNSNNWTPNNLSVGFPVTQNYSTTTSGTAPTPYNSTIYVEAFDGNLSTAFFWTPGTWAMTWTSLPSAVTVSSTLRIYCYPRLGTITVNINGSNVASITGNTVDWRTISFTGTINTISFTGTDTYSGVYAIEVDGAILIDPRANSVNDSLVDTPTSFGTDTSVGGEVRGNYATFNPLNKHNASDALSNGNLDLVAAGGSAGLAPSTIGVSSGKWYCEFVFTGGTANDLLAGIRRADSRNYDNSYLYRGNSNLVTNGSVGSNYGSGFVLNDVVGVAFDADNGKLFISVNGTFTGSGNPVTGANPAFSSITGTYNLIVGTYNNICNATVNFGQRAFAYTAPSGFKALCDTNLGAPLIAKGNTVMDVALYTGNGSTQTISGLNFSPDLVWIKARSTSAYNHFLLDTVRGVNNELNSNTTDFEYTRPAPGSLTAFNSDGFNLNTAIGVNASSTTYVAWTWDAGTTTASNGSGSITSQVRANVSAGFSVVTYSTGASSGNQTIGHGLNVTPSLIIHKVYSATSNWWVYHASTTNTVSKYLQLNSTSATADNIHSMWGAALPTSTVFGANVGQLLTTNQSAVAYCFAPVAGYSSFGSYTGNGSADGPFIFTSFRPRWILIKNSSATADWSLFDTARDSYNQALTLLAPNLPAADNVLGSGLDILSNGFKLRRDASPAINASSNTFVYAAFAENPLQYSRAR